MDLIELVSVCVFRVVLVGVSDWVDLSMEIGMVLVSVFGFGRRGGVMKLSSPHTPYGPCLLLAQVKVSDIFFDHGSGALGSFRGTLSPVPLVL